MQKNIVNGPLCVIHIIRMKIHHVLYVRYDSGLLSSQILEDDWITVYGELTGVYTYKSICGNNIMVPSLTADSVELS